MASKNLVLKDATWNGVESVDFPVSGGGTARYIETSDATAVAADIAQNKTAYVNGSLITGTATPTIPNIQALSVTENGTYTASGGVDGYSPVTVNVSGGGGQYPWFGDGAEKVGTIINRTINLKDDTNYDSWTASTTATTLIAADSDPYYSTTFDIDSYDYCIVTKGFMEPVYVSGTPATYRTKRVCQYHVQYYVGVPATNTVADVQADRATANTSFTSSTTFHVQYYYSSTGELASRPATQCGPLYMSGSPTLGLSTSNWSFTYKFPAFTAKCDAARFSTERKTQVDSANTNYVVTVDLYRVPRGNSLMSHWAREMNAVLNTE